jgi:hypothetical protein
VQFFIAMVDVILLVVKTVGHLHGQPCGRKGTVRPND